MKLDNIQLQQSEPQTLWTEQPGVSNDKLAISELSTEQDILAVSSATQIYGGVAVETNRSSPDLEITPTPTPSTANSYTLNTKDSTSQWSQSLQTVLDQPPASFPKQVLWAGILFGCGFAVWAWVGTVQEVRSAQGRLIPQGEVYKVQPVAEGKIAKLLVKEGQQVEAREVIAELDTREAMTNVERLEKSLSAHRLELLQTQSLIDKTRLEAQTRLKIAAEAVDDQSSTIQQAQVSVETSRRLLSQLQADSTAYQARLDRLKPLIQEGAIAGDQVFEVEQAIRDRRKSMIESQGGLDKALLEGQQLQTRLSQKQAEQQRLALEIQQELQQLEIKVADIKAKINETTTLLQQAQAQLKQQYLRSPVKGIVSSLNIRNIGEVTQAGQTVAEIASSKAPLLLSAVLPSRDAGLVKEGMPVQLKLDAFPYQEYGTIPGRVTFISADSKKDDQLGAVYRVEISLDRTYVTHEQKKISLKAGQTANAEIVLRQRRLADILLDPIRKLTQDHITL